MSAFAIGPKLPVIDFQSDGSVYGDNMRHVLRMLQVLVEPNVISLALNAPPGAPNNGDTYIVAAGGTGVWAGQDQNIAYWTTDDPNNPGGDWEFYTPLKGWVAANQADGNLYKYTGSAWATFGGGGVTSVTTTGIATGGGTGAVTVGVPGSGTESVAATADASIDTAPAGDVVTTDGSGNVQDSGVLLSSLGGRFATPGQNFFFGAGLQSLHGLGAASTSLVAVAQTVYVFAFNLDVEWVLTTASYISENSGANDYFGFGIYSSARNALVRTSFLSTNIAGTLLTNTFSPVTLLPGMYYFAQAADSTGLSAPAIDAPGTGSVTQSQLYQLLNANGQFTAATAANSMGANTGVMPPTLGALTGLTTQITPMASIKWTP